MTLAQKSLTETGLPTIGCNFFPHYCQNSGAHSSLRPNVHRHGSRPETQLSVKRQSMLEVCKFYDSSAEIYSMHPAQQSRCWHLQDVLAEREARSRTVNRLTARIGFAQYVPGETVASPVATIEWFAGGACL